MNQQIKRLYRNFAEGANEQHIPELFKMWRCGVIVPAARWTRLRLRQHCKEHFGPRYILPFNRGVEILNAVSALDAYTEALVEPEAQRFDIQGQPAEQVTLRDALRALYRYQLPMKFEVTNKQLAYARYNHDLFYYRLVVKDRELFDLIYGNGQDPIKPKLGDYPDAVSYMKTEAELAQYK